MVATVGGCQRTGAGAVALACAAIIVTILCQPRLVESAQARSIEVAPAPTDAVPGLESALAAAVEGDTLLLAPGLYRGVYTLKPGVSLIGTAGPDSTVLDADGGRYILYGRDIDDRTTIAGLTLQNGRRDHPNSGGGGIYLYQSSPTILNCVFRNHLGYLGPGVYANHRSHPIVAYCVFHDIEGYLGGAIAAYVDCDPLIYNNVIHDNTAISGGAILALNSAPLIVGNTIVANTASDAGGGAIYLDSSPALIEANVLAHNEGSGAVFCLDADRPPMIRGNLLCRNSENSERSRCAAFLGLDGNREGNPLFDDLDGRELWRRTAPVDSSGVPGAGAAPWDPKSPPEVPQDLLERWHAWRNGAVREADPR